MNQIDVAILPTTEWLRMRKRETTAGDYCRRLRGKSRSKRRINVAAEPAKRVSERGRCAQEAQNGRYASKAAVPATAGQINHTLKAAIRSERRPPANECNQVIARRAGNPLSLLLTNANHSP